MSRAERPCPRILAYKPPRIAMLLLLIAAALQFLAPAVWPTLTALPLTGSITAALGFSIMLRAWWLFRAHKTAICPTARTTSLITDDIYRLTRNPMYLGIVLMLFGVALGTGHFLFYLAALAFFLIIEFAFCPFEEAKLARDFGERFTTYRENVRRWL